jgi:membrane-bound lytic murein transglycosylase B
MIGLAVWLFALPFLILAALGFRRLVALACLFVLAVTVYGIAQDLGLLEAPAQASPGHRRPARKPARSPAQPPASSTARGDIPAGYLALYQQAGRRYRVPWSVLAGIGKVESDHGRSPLPGVRSGANSAGACGPMQIGCVPGSKAGNSWATYGRGDPHDPANAIPAAARYLVGHGAHRNLDRAIYGYNHAWWYVANVKRWAARYRGGR